MHRVTQVATTLHEVREFVDSWPFWAVYALFFCGALVRSHATYAVGRALRTGATRTAGRRAASPGPHDPSVIMRLGQQLEGPGLQRAERVMARYGPPLVTVSFLTLGVQTLLNAAAGALRMPLRRYTPAAVLGSLIWAALYTTAGFAVLGASRAAVPWWWLLVATALIVCVVLVTRGVRRRLDAAA